MVDYIDWFLKCWINYTFLARTLLCYCLLLFLYIVGFDLLIFFWGFCMYVQKMYFVSMFKRYMLCLCSNFLFLVCFCFSLSLSSFCISNASLIKRSGNHSLLFCFLEDLFMLDVISSLNIWWNLELKLSGTRDFHWLRERSIRSS